jgi:nitrogenase molybdenum-cofactor synthesis protein NifE
VEFEGYDGFLNFARELDVSVNSPVWRYVGSKLENSCSESVVTKESGSHSVKNAGSNTIESNNMHETNTIIVQESVA